MWMKSEVPGDFWSVAMRDSSDPSLRSTSHPLAAAKFTIRSISTAGVATVVCSL